MEGGRLRVNYRCFSGGLLYTSEGQKLGYVYGAALC